LGDTLWRWCELESRLVEMPSDFAPYSLSGDERALRDRSGK
jgi:hypothetical protein